MSNERHTTRPKASARIALTLGAAGRSLLLVWALLSTVAPAAAAEPRPGDLASKWPVDDENPIAHVPTVEERNGDPLEFGYFLQDLMARAQVSLGAENWPDVVKYGEALAVALPDMARPFSMLCVAYAKIGKIEVAQAYCARATNLPGARVLDHLRFLDVTLRKEKLTQEDLDAAEASLNHLRGHAAQYPQSLPDAATAAASLQVPETGDDLMKKLAQQRREKRAASAAASGAPPVPELPTEPAAKEPSMYLPIEIELRECKLAALAGNDQKLTACMTALRGHKLDSRLLLPFTWAQALMHKDKVLSEQLFQEAKGLGLPDEVLASMSRDQDRVFTSPVYRALRWLAAVLAILSLAFYGVTRARKRRAARVPSPQPTAPAADAMSPQAGSHEATTEG